ncbi:MAG: transaldolase [Propionibacteriaceae bacterium]|jgi:transaldolase|nr:transaldolase [Propionibacteriaceae bacterium]
MNERLQALRDAGVSIWLDDLSRDRLTSGSLKALITSDGVAGVTTNPTIFAQAFADMSQYGADLAELKAQSATVTEAIRSLMAADVAQACDLFADVYQSSRGYDGRVSIEVDPTLAHDTAQTVEAAQTLQSLVDRPNVMVKIPATSQGLPAIRAAVGAGISVNATLIFSLDRYREVMEAYLGGLEDALDLGQDISNIHSVASFFISRVDTEVDRRLDAIGTKAATDLKGKAALANARMAYDVYLKVFESDRFAQLKAAGANYQRPLWASTGVKNPAYPDTMYVDELVGRHCVNTMPEATLRAAADHANIAGDTVRCWIAPATATWAQLRGIGIDYDDVTSTLETEGVDKFIASWAEVVEAVGKAMAAV